MAQGTSKQCNETDPILIKFQRIYYLNWKQKPQMYIK